MIKLNFLPFVIVFFPIISCFVVHHEVMALELKSSAFENMKMIPKKFTCDGKDISPPLTISDIPENTKSLAIIVDDPDAPNGTFDHWIAWNIKPSVTELPEGASVPNQGKNHFGEVRYRGPCPPPGAPHRYFFKLYALDTMINLKEGTSKKELQSALEGHILDQVNLIGIYQREATEEFKQQKISKLRD